MNSVLETINARVRNALYLEFAIYSFSKDTLVIVGSQDLIYYHEFEIIFEDVFTISCNSFWHIGTNQPFIHIVSDIAEIRSVIIQYGIEIGYTIFKLDSEDKLAFYIAAKNLSFKENLVKYYL